MTNAATPSSIDKAPCMTPPFLFSGLHGFEQAIFLLGFKKVESDTGYFSRPGSYSLLFKPNLIDRTNFHRIYSAITYQGETEEGANDAIWFVHITAFDQRGKGQLEGLTPRYYRIDLPAGPERTAFTMYQSFLRNFGGLNFKPMYPRKGYYGAVEFERDALLHGFKRRHPDATNDGGFLDEKRTLFGWSGARSADWHGRELKVETCLWENRKDLTDSFAIQKGAPNRWRMGLLVTERFPDGCTDETWYSIDLDVTSRHGALQFGESFHFNFATRNFPDDFLSVYPTPKKLWDLPMCRAEKFLVQASEVGLKAADAVFAYELLHGFSMLNLSEDQLFLSEDMPYRIDSILFADRVEAEGCQYGVLIRVSKRGNNTYPWRFDFEAASADDARKQYLVFLAMFDGINRN